MSVALRPCLALAWSILLALAVTALREIGDNPHVDPAITASERPKPSAWGVFGVPCLVCAL